MDRNETVRISRSAAFDGLTETDVNMVLVQYCIGQGKKGSYYKSFNSKKIWLGNGKI